MPEVRILISAELLDWMEAFLYDRHSAGLSLNTVDFYRTGLDNFMSFCAMRGIQDVEMITPNIIRRYLLSLENSGHNGGGVHAKWRAVRAFLNWYELEMDDDSFRNPVRKLKVKPPRTPLLDPADIEAVKAILKDCDRPRREKINRLMGYRDKAIIYTMIDTGLRASELIGLMVEQVNTITGVISNVRGKGGSYRTVYLGKKGRQALRKYIRMMNPTEYLWIGRYGNQLTRSGLRQMMVSRCESAGVPMQPLHSFRRLFAISMLRAGVDIYSLQLLMGHESTKVLERYLKLTRQDTKEAHIKGSPVDNLL